MSSERPADPFAALVRELDLEHLHLRQMLALAAEERRDLVAGALGRLGAITSERLAQLDALELYDARRRACLVALGCAPDAQGLAACAASAGRRGPALTAARARVSAALATLQELNQENDALLRARLAALGALPGGLAELGS
jgi:flagellar biosynthesis/type III secretory pathway chaperone